MSTTPKPLPPAGIRVEPDIDVEIVRRVFVDGEDTEPGDIVTTDGNSANILMGEGSAKPTAAPTGPPVNKTAPYVSGVGTLGEKLHCTMGTWDGEPTSYAYGWKRASTDPALPPTDIGTGPDYTVAAIDSGHSITCIVTAANALGSTISPPSNAVLAA
jgi:hypothetical protein